MNTLNGNHRNDLKKSGLTDETIEKAGFYSVLDADEYSRLANLPAHAHASIPALGIPYPGCPGYVRLRPDSATRPNPEYRDNSHGHNYGRDAEEQSIEGPKYVSPVGSSVRLYKRLDMCPAILDRNKPLLLTEGEKKTLAAIQAGLACVGAPGVTCFGDSAGRWAAKGSGKDERRLHRDFDDIPLQGRKVVICFDSDIDEKTAVLRAAIALAQMLEEAGADVHIAYLDSAKDGSKQGLDDLLASLPEPERLGPNPLGCVMDAARPFNVVECVNTYLANDWDWFSPERRKVELGRVVRLASYLLTRKGDLEKFVKQCSRELHVPLSQVEPFVVKAEKARDHDPRVWLADWMTRQGVLFESRNSADAYVRGGEVVESEALLTQMALDSVTFGGPQRQNIADALLLWRNAARKQALREVVAALNYRPGLDDSHVRALVRAVTGAEDPVDVAVMKHFIWQVKRKLNEMLVEDHLMVILYGAQRVGKSEAIRKLLGPVQRFKDEPGDLTVVGDERQVFRFARSYVMFFDEMAKAQKTDMEAFKNRISQPTVSWRVLGSNVRENQPNRATFIGASNWPLQDLINDPTGVRRFYQVNCQSPIDWDAINSIDYTALWASVNENDPAPIKKVLGDLHARQEEMRVRDAVEEFLAERCDLADEWTRAKPVWLAFKEFLDSENYMKSIWSNAKFGRRFTQLVGEKRKRNSNGVLYQVRLRPASDLCDQAQRVAEEDAANEPMTNGTKASA